MHPRKLTLECILLYGFGILIELRNIIVKDYFPFVPDALMGKRMLQWNINCSTTSAFVESKKKGIKPIDLFSDLLFIPIYF